MPAAAVAARISSTSCSACSTGASIELEQPGHLPRCRATRIDVALRAARFADETRPASILSIVAGDEGDREPRATATARTCRSSRLEPLLIGSIFPIHGEDRIVVTPEEVPPLLPAALKAVEDRKFDTHHGVDPVGIARALWVNVRAGSDRAGRQHADAAARQELLPRSAADARPQGARGHHGVALDAHFSKADLMNAYINEIFLGQDGDRAIHGFGLASQFYFGKPLAELDLSEVALLVAIVRGPSYYDPRRHPDRARARRDLVLKLMAERGIVEARRCARGREASRSASRRVPRALTIRRIWISCGARCGATIATRISPRPVCGSTRASSRARRIRPSTPWSASWRGSITRSKYPDAKLEGAVVVTSPQSGDVIAIVGSRNVGYDGFNRALDARRPMGSLVKPFIYLTALETGRYNAATIVQDAPVDIKLAERHVLAAGEFHEADLWPGAARAGARRVAESCHRRRRHGCWVCRKIAADPAALRPRARRRRRCPSMLLGRDRRHADGSRAALQRAGQWRLPHAAARRARCHQRRRQAAQGVSAGGDAGRDPGGRLSKSIG